MKLVVLTYGTDGDTRPMIALCRGLMDAGHAPHLLADEGTLALAHALGVPCSPIAGDIRGLLDPAAGISGVVQEGASFTRTAQALARIANTHAQAWMGAAVEAGQGCDGLILSGLAGFAGLSAAQALGIPAVGTSIIPLTPTAEFASPFLPPRWVPRALHRASHRVANRLFWYAFRKAINRARASVGGLPPLRALPQGHPMLYGVSPTLLPQPRDWPGNAQVCGQWPLPAPDWSPPGPLMDFLAAGDAPVYVGFGSMVGFEPRRMRDVIVEGVAGRRAVFHPGWSGMDTAGLPSNIFVVGETPHAWLFPRMSAVVHHGGAGTAHSATRAGVPSVVVPFAGDQPFWAERLRRLGAAPPPLDVRKLTGTQLGQAIAATESGTMRGRARELGEAMGAEDGLAAAVGMIERLIAAGGKPPEHRVATGAQHAVGRHAVRS